MPKKRKSMKDNGCDVYVGFQKIANGFLILTEKRGEITPFAFQQGGNATFGDTLATIISPMLEGRVVTKRKPRKAKAAVVAPPPDLFREPKKRGRKKKYATKVETPPVAKEA